MKVRTKNEILRHFLVVRCPCFWHGSPVFVFVEIVPASIDIDPVMCVMPMCVCVPT